MNNKHKNLKTVKLAIPYRPVRGEMGRTEEKYARRLDMMKAAGRIVDYKFEAVTFRIAKKTSYTPDFMVIYEDHIEFHEVKGYWQEDAWIKFKTVADENKWAKWVIVTWDTKKKDWRVEEHD